MIKDFLLFACFGNGGSSTCERSASGGQKKAPDPFEPELQIVQSYHVGTGNLTGILY